MERRSSVASGTEEKAESRIETEVGEKVSPRSCSRDDLGRRKLEEEAEGRRGREAGGEGREAGGEGRGGRVAGVEGRYERRPVRCEERRGGERRGGERRGGGRPE